ncbi:patatin-like phospholipase family protein [Trinickia violacea]|uniref:Patatin-like phospholipase family protein n=1 Tax=Trinickia violacea TaxID=2571746 RepID=A0A4V1EHE6_9BURK|nr:patatin-like phospholipase family protein [Trinickia violacea]QCP50000.1 patatin-like phospholipase family protein [Trinickia violacea]
MDQDAPSGRSGPLPAQQEEPDRSACADIPGQIVFVLQGGGALGAYQAGVYEALHDAGVEPDWVIGTSIGAINGAIIAGNPRERRLARLREFWRRVAYPGSATGGWFPFWDDWLRNLAIVTQGISPFFTPRPGAWLGLQMPVGVDQAAFYTTEPLRETLNALVDFDYLNAKEKATRLTVGTVGVANGRMRYFTNRDAAFSVDHVMASAAFPPGFPSVRVDGETYWDGGVYSNTPLEAVLDDHPRRSSVIFAVQLWPAHGPEPVSIWQAMGRQRDIQYSSRAESHLERQRQIHRLRHVIRELGKHIPEGERDSAAIQELLAWGCGTTMRVIELDAPCFNGDELHKDIDFSSSGIERRWAVGYDDTLRMLRRAPWREDPDPMEGISVHRMERGVER